MSSLASPELSPRRSARRRTARLNALDLRANRALKWLALAGGGLIFLTLIAVAYQVINGASDAVHKYGITFVGHSQWVAGAGQFGAGALIFGTLVTAVCSVILATILGVSIGLLLSLMAPRRVAAVLGPLVEMLAAIPSVVLGMIGIYLICPFIRSDVEPWLHSGLGFLPFFGAPQPVGNSLFAASLVLTIMVVPIIAALTRDLFMTVPLELRDGAEALGATRWEMIRGVVLPTTQSGVVAACVLGFGRAIGEAIAVSLVVGGVVATPANWFKGGDTLAAMIANEFASPVSALHKSSLYFLALVLLVMGLAVNLTAHHISDRFERSR